MNSKRVYWIDIYKAIAISLVVIGHSTGQYNAYIYQFHVAAFFFISGYVSKMDKDCFGKELYKKFMSLIVPLFTMVFIFGVVIEGLKLTGTYGVFYDIETEATLLISLKNFIINGSMIDLLGAAWFVWVLFATVILSHLLYIISRKNRAIFSSLTVLVYIIGYYKIKGTGGGYLYGLDLSLMAQCYYGIAFSIKSVVSYNEKKINGKKNTVISRSIIFFMTSTFMYIMKTYLPDKSIMDLANRGINNIWWSTIAVTNGIIWLYSLSKLISCINIRMLIKIFDAIGKNTMGIMLLHFSFFRIISYAFYKIGVVPVETCKNLVPPSEVGVRFWTIYVIVAIVGSILMWTAFAKVPVLNQLLGLDKSFMNKLPNFEPCKQIIKLYNIVADTLIDAWKDYIKNLKMSKQRVAFHITISVVVVLILAGCKFIPSIIANNGSGIVNGEIAVEFPYNGNVVRFGEGWLAQTSDEKYRWAAKESEFVICLGDQNKIRLNGYVPNGIEDISKIELYMNGTLIAECGVREEEQIAIEADFAEQKVEGDNTFRIIFDSVRVPKPEENDQRSFSALFNSIIVE